METLTYEPRFLVFRSVAYLVRCAMDGQTIVGVDGPYQAAGEPGASPTDVAKAFGELLNHAAERPSVGYDEMPEATKRQLDEIAKVMDAKAGVVEEKPKAKKARAKKKKA